jgi:hypothetical protein
MLTLDGSEAGTAIFNNDLILLSDAAVIHFGADKEITLTHVADSGLTLKHTAAGDDKPIVLTLQTGETDIAADDVIGTINFQAPNEGTGTDAILVCAGIEAVSEGDFSSSNNATKLSFKTGASEAASEKMSLSSAGNLTVTGNLTTNGALKITPTETASSTSSTTITVDFSTIGDYIYTLSTGVTAVTINASNMTSSKGRQGTIIIKTPSSGTWSTTWATDGHWYFESGTPPSLSSNYDVYDVFSYYIVADNEVLISSSSSFESWTG